LPVPPAGPLEIPRAHAALEQVWAEIERLSPLIIMALPMASGPGRPRSLSVFWRSLWRITIWCGWQWPGSSTGAAEGRPPSRPCRRPGRTVQFRPNRSESHPPAAL